MTCDIWKVITDRLHLTLDKWHLAPHTWNVTPDTWLVVNIVSSFFFYRSRTNDVFKIWRKRMNHWLIQLLCNKAVCNTAPASLGLLIRGLKCEQKNSTVFLFKFPDFKTFFSPKLRKKRRKKVYMFALRISWANIYIRFRYFLLLDHLGKS